MTTRRHRPDFALVILVLGLLMLGLIVIFSIGPLVAQFENSQSGSNFGAMYFFTHHLVAVALAIAALVAGYTVPYQKLAQGAKALVLTALGLCLMVSLLGALHVQSLVTCDLGACRSLRLPGLGMGFQPVELLKLGLLFYLAGLIAKRKANNLLAKKELWVPVGVLAALTAVMVGWWQKDLGSTVVIMFMLVCMVFVGGVKWQQLLLILGVGAVAVLALVLLAPHRLQRLASFNGGGDKYHIENALVGLGTGGLFGVGLGNSIQATGYLPEALSDSIFAIIGEIWGFAGTALVLAAFFALLMRILRAGRLAANTEQTLCAVGVFAWLAAHVIINVGGMTGITPMKGITLPFLSYGGTSMLFVSFAIGVVLQISGWARRETEHEDSYSWRRQRGARHATYRRGA